MKSDRWTMVALFLIALNLRPALASVGPVMEAIRNDLNLSYRAAGLLTMLPVLCMGAFAPLAGCLQRRMGLRNAVNGSTWLLAGALLMRGLPTQLSLWLSTLLAGAMIAVLGPLLAAFIKQAFAARSSLMTTLLSAGICLGASIAAGATAPLNLMSTWNWALASWALPALLAAAAWQASAPAQVPAAVLDPRAPRLWKKPRAYLLMLAFGLQSAVFYALLAWLAPAYGELGLSETAAGGLLSLMTLLQIAGTLLIGLMHRGQGDRRPAMLLCGLLSLAGLIGLAAAPLLASWLWMILLGAGAGGLFTATLILPLDYGDTPEAAGEWTSVMLTGGYLIAAAGPYLAGVLRDQSDSYLPVFVVLAGLGAFVCLLSLGLKPIRNPKNLHGHG